MVWDSLGLLPGTSQRYAEEVMELMKTIKATYRNGLIEPMEALEIPNGTELNVTIETTSPLLGRVGEEDWQRWRGILKGTSALQDHEREHREEANCIAEDDQSEIPQRTY